MGLTRDIRFVIGNRHDTATLTATSEALPVTNTQRSERALVWRSTSLAEQVLEGVMTGGAIVQCIGLFRHNLGPGGLRRIQLFNDGSLVYDSGPVATALIIPAGIWRAGIDPWGATYNDQLPGAMPSTILWLERPYVANSYRIILADPSNGDGYMELGRVIVGDVFQPKFNFGWSPKLQWVESGEHRITEGGSVRTVGLGDLRRRFEFNLDWLTDQDRSQLVSKLGKAGLGATLMVSLYPNASSTLLELEGQIVCRRENQLGHTHNMHGNWQLPLAFLEE